VRRAAAVAVLVLALLPVAVQPAEALFAYIHVNNGADEDSILDGLCSLREAIIATNHRPTVENECTSGSTGIDRILFDVSTVNITSQLPTITVPVIMDSNLGGALVDLHGPGSATGLVFASGASGSVVRNMTIENFANGISTGVMSSMTIAANVIGPNSGTGISLGGGPVTIGGANPRTPGFCSGDCNRISGNTNFGIVGFISGGTIKGNVIGLDSTGTAAQANGRGIDVAGSNVTIGGSTADERNVVSGNAIGIDSEWACNCTIKGNYIGTDVSGTAAVPNGDGVLAYGQSSGQVGQGTHTTIGGSAPGEGNVISGNSAIGIMAQTWGPYDSLNIYGNRIGVNAAGAPLMNTTDGIVLGGGSDWAVHINVGNPSISGAANEIAHNGGDGIELRTQYATGDYIRGDSIHDNAGKGINLNGTANDAIVPPTITGLNPVHGAACAGCTVDVYSDTASQGKTYEGSATADGSGNWTFSGTPVGPKVTATATDAARGTSEFSAPATASAPKKPDGRIRKGSGSFVGNNIYNTTGLNQTRSGSTTPGNTITFGISIQNDASTGDQFKVHATGTSLTGYTIKYFHGTTDITAAVVAGTYTTPALAAGGTFLITAKVKVTSTAAVGSSVTRLITLTSGADGSKKDAVKFVVKRS